MAVGAGRRRRVRRLGVVDAYPHVLAGAQVATVALARDLAARHDVEVRVVVPGEGPLTEALEAAGVDHHVVAPPAPLRRFGGAATRGPSRLAAVLAALPVTWARLGAALRGLDAVHLNDHRGAVLAGPAAAGLRLPAVWHVHGIVASRAINVGAGRMVRGVVVPTAAALERLPGLPARVPVAVVPYGRPPAPHHHRRAPGPAPTLGTVARLHPDKDLAGLLRAVAVARRQVPDLRLVVVGGPQAGSEAHARELERLAAGLGLGGAVTFTGADPGPLGRLAEAGATLYVQASRERSELLPLAVIEAMAAGYPVLATDVGGLAELVVPAETGRLVPAGDPAALAAAIVDLLADPAALDRIGDGARHRAASRHTEASMLDHLVAAYARFGLDLG